MTQQAASWAWAASAGCQFSRPAADVRADLAHVGDIARPLLETDRRIVEIVREALAPYGAGAALVEVLPWDRETWGIEVQPTRQGCAPVLVGFDGVDLSVLVSQTWWDWIVDEATLDALRDVVDAVFAGQFEEAGGGESAFGRVLTRSGLLRAGHAHWPVPWRWRRKVRRFLPYRGA